ncbi:MAG: 30S ribosomal protein S9 [Nitrososphaerales archaeon]
MTKKKQQQLLLVSGERKTARATAAIRAGIGRVRINKVPVEIWTPYAAKEVIMTPLIIAGDMRNKVDIDVEVKGGGVMGQAYAAAMAIARALVEFFNSEELKAKITAIDEHLIKGDPRQTEPKKFGGPGPRRRRQKSYR